MAGRTRSTCWSRGRAVRCMSVRVVSALPAISMRARPQGVLDFACCTLCRRRLGLGRLVVGSLQTVTIDPGQVVLGPLGKVLVVLEAVGEVCDRFDSVCVRGGDQGHVPVADIGAVLCLVGEGRGEIAHRDYEGLLDDVRIERHPGDLAELGQPWPLVDDEGDRLPQERVGLDELVVDLLLAHLPELQHLRHGVVAMVEHPLLRAELELLGPVIVVEDLVVDFTSYGVLGGVVLLDGPELQVAVGIAYGLLELICLVVIEVLREDMLKLVEIG